MTGSATRIGTLRVRGNVRSDPAVRVRVSSLVEGTSFAPRSMPPSAILVVRRLGDPLPGSLAPRGSGVRPPADWERAVRDELEAISRRAARAAAGPIPSSAEAVLFRDQAELLACLLADLARGIADRRWWWAAPLRELGRGPEPGRVAAALLRSPWLVPATLVVARNRGEAAVVLGSLGEEDARNVLVATLQAFQASIPPPAPAERPPRTRPSGDADADRDAPGVAPSRGPDPDTPARGRPPEPWAPWVPSRDVPAGLTGFRRILLGVALALHRSPAGVRSADFRVALARHVEAAGPANGTRHPGAAPPGRPLVTRGPPGREVYRNPLPPLIRAKSTGVDGPIADHAGPRRVAGPTGPASAARSIALGHQAAAPGTDVQEEGEEIRPASSPEPHPARGGVERPETDPKPPPTLEAARTATDAGLVTGLAGVLYLINVMTHLGLPHCFEASWRLASVAGPWGTLEALGRSLLGGRHDGAVEDPLWRVLRELAGREADEGIGAGLPPDAAYRMPGAWLAALPGDVHGCRWAARGPWLEIWEEGGNVLARVPRADDRPARQAAALLEGWGVEPSSLRRSAMANAPEERVPPSAAPVLDPALRRWLRLVLPFVRSRIAAAVGDRPVAELLLAPGRVNVTSSHVDLVLPAEAASVPIRRAGLDRDPGWLPDFGRVVLFHFESDRMDAHE